VYVLIKDLLFWLKFKQLQILTSTIFDKIFRPQVYVFIEMMNM